MADAGESPVAPAEGPADRPRRTGHARGRGGLIAGAVVLAVLAAGGAVFAVLWSRGGAGPVPLEESRRPTGSTMPSAPAVLRPPQGLYLYRGSGSDRLDAPPKEQAEGPDMPATVTHRPDGCWTFRIDYSTNHWQSWDYCPRQGGLEEIGGSTYQKWDFVVFVSESTSTFVCDPAVTIKADQQPGDTWEQSCTGTGATSDGAVLTAGPYTFVGPEAVDVGSESVPAYRYHRERTMSGAQTGTERSDVWFSAATGMPLRNQRRLEVRTSSIIGEVAYTEDAEFALTSTEPRT